MVSVRFLGSFFVSISGLSSSRPSCSLSVSFVSYFHTHTHTHHCNLIYHHFLVDDWQTHNLISTFATRCSSRGLKWSLVFQTSAAVTQVAPMFTLHVFMIESEIPYLCNVVDIIIKCVKCHQTIAKQHATCGSMWKFKSVFIIYLFYFFIRSWRFFTGLPLTDSVHSSTPSFDFTESWFLKRRVLMFAASQWRSLMATQQFSHTVEH